LTMEAGKRRYALLTDGYLADRHAKTAHGMLRYAHDDIVAVVDARFGGRRLSEVLPSLQRSKVAARHRDVPIVRSIAEALEFSPTSLLVGVATAGGVLPPHFRAHILEAVDAGLEIVSGLHEFLADDPELVRRAARSGARLWDVRRPPAGIPLFSGAAYDVPQIVVLAVGSDCAVGKKSTMIELAAAAQAAGDRVEFVATGQTGIMISGKGIVVDRVISDFVSGAAEQLVLGVDPSAQYALVEGQGGIVHPAYAAVTLGLLYGCAPDMLVLCHEAGRVTVEDFDIRIPSLSVLRETYEALLAPIKPAACVAVALNTENLDDEQARACIAETKAEMDLPVDDVVRFGADQLWRAIRDAARDLPKPAPTPEAAGMRSGAL
jgi:uncharacterized NAD-dependent epimerase/dehydratase family protein